MDHCPDALGFFVSRTILIHSTNFVHLLRIKGFFANFPSLQDFEDSSQSCAESDEHFSIPNPAQNCDNGWPVLNAENDEYGWNHSSSTGQLAEGDHDR